MFWELVTPMKVFKKLRHWMWNPNPVHSSELEVGGSLRTVWCYAGVYGKCFSAFPPHFYVGISLCAVFGSLWEGITNVQLCILVRPWRRALSNHLWHPYVGQLFWILSFTWMRAFLQVVVTHSSSVPYEVNPHFENCDLCNFNMRSLSCVAASFPYESHLHDLQCL